VLLHFIRAYYNYPLLFIWSIFEGEVGLALAGSLTKTGQFRFEYILLIAVLGALIGDVSVFIAGRVFRTRAEHWLQHYRQRLTHVKQWLLRYGGWVLIFERFIFGTHIPALLMIGVSDFPVWRFLLLDFIGVVLWATTFTSLGCYFGGTFVSLLGIIQKHLNVVLFVAIFCFAVRWFYLKSKKGR